MAKKNDNKKAAPVPEEAPVKGQEETAEERIAALGQELEQQKALLAKEKDDYMRLMAEFETFRRRSAEDRLNLVASAAADTIKGMLPVLDDCEQAIKVLTETGDQAALEGTNLIYNKLLGYLKEKGLEVIQAKGEPFDTDLHEAVAQFPAGEEGKGKVFDGVQTGYTFAGKVIRFAKVVVGS